MKTLLSVLLFSICCIYSQAQQTYFVKVKNNAAVNIEFDSTQNLDFHPFKSIIKRFDIEQISSPFKTKDENLQNTFVLKLDAGKSESSFYRDLMRLDFIEYVEQVPEVETFYTPNDPLYAQQYALPLINGDLAWDIVTCSSNSSVVLAVIDDAVRINHEDLLANIWINPNEIPGNGIDDDNNGYIDDVNGWDAADNDNDPNPHPSANNSYFAHGTHVAGIASASTDNNVGLAAIGNGLVIMPVKIGANSSSSLTGAFQGVDYAIASGYVDIVNMSWGGGSYSTTYQNLFNAGHNAGITFVAAAGNSNTNAPMYPASYNHIISVAASDQADQRAVFSNYGSTIDVTAPGVAILSSVPLSTSSYYLKSGTSMAAPLVAGLCGLMKCLDNTLTPDEIESCLESSATNIDAQNPSFINQLGAGRIDAQAAIQCLIPTPIVSFYTDDTLVCPNQVVQFNDESTGSQPMTWSWQFPGGVPSTSTVQNPTVTYPSTGTYSVTLTVTNLVGNDILTKTNYIQVQDPSATISGNSNITAGSTSYLKFDFTGTPPFSVVYSDGTNNFTENGITQNPFYLGVTPSQNTTYTLVSMEDGFCTGAVNGSANCSVSIPSASLDCYYGNSYGPLADMAWDFAYNQLTDVTYTCGTTQSGKPFVMASDIDGSLLWLKSYNAVFSAFSRVLIADNGSDLILGCRYNDDFYLTRLDENGDFIWSKRYNAGSGESALMLEKSIGDTYLAFGRMDGASDDLALFRFDGTGNILWSYKYHETDDQNYAITSDGNGGCIVGGSLEPPGYDYFISHIDLNGNEVISSKAVDGGDVSRVYALYKDGSDYYIAGGDFTFSSTARFYIARLDANMNVVWRKSTPYLPNSGPYRGGMTKDNLGNFYWYTPNRNGNTTFDEMIVQFDANGNIKKVKSSIYDSHTTLLWVKNTGSLPYNDLLWMNNSNAFPYNNRIGIARTDSSINSCMFTDIPDSFTNDSHTGTSFSFTRSTTNYAVTSLNFVATLESGLYSEICPTVCAQTSDSNCLYVDAFQKISDTEGNFLANLDDSDVFGIAVEAIGDINGDGVIDLAVSAALDDDAGVDKGAIYILFMNTNGTVNSHSKISPTNPLLSGVTEQWGSTISNIGDLNGDGVNDIAVGEHRSNSGGSDKGSLWILFLNANGTLNNAQQISQITGGNTPNLSVDDYFGTEVTSLGDLNGDGVVDLAVGAPRDDDGGSNKGAVYILFMNTNGTVASFQKISSTQGGFSGSLDNDDNFGVAVENIGDYNGDGINELAVGSYLDDDGMPNSGAIWILQLSNTGNVITQNKISGLSSNLTGILDNNDQFGNDISRAGDLDGDGVNDLVVSSSLDDDGGTNKGAIYFVYLNPNLTVKSINKISDLTPSFSGQLDADDYFAHSIGSVGDFNSDGFPDFLVGAVFDDDGGNNRGAAYLLFIEDSCISSISQPNVCVNSSIDTVVCSGDSIQLMAGSGTNYNWIPSSNLSNPNIQNPKVESITTNTSYVVAYLSLDSCWIFDTINLIPNQPAVWIAQNDTVICTNDSLYLSAFGATNYVWSSNASLSNLTGNYTLIYPTSGVVNVNVVGTNSFGCVSEDSVQVEFLSCCGGFADIQVQDSVVCVGNNVLFENESIFGNNASFTWDFGPNATPSNFTGFNPPIIVYSSPGVYEVTMILSDDCGVDTAFQNIYINDIPSYDIAADTTLCTTDTFVYEIGGIEIVGNTYNWTPSLGLNYDNVSDPIATINSSMTYVLYVEDQFTGCYAYDTVEIEISNVSTDFIELVQNSACVNDTALLFVNIPYDSIVWSTGQIQVDTINLLLLQDTSITVTLFDGDCTSEDSLFIPASLPPSFTVDFFDTLCLGEWDTLSVITFNTPVWEGVDTSFTYPVQLFSDTNIQLSVYNGFCAIDTLLPIYTVMSPIGNIQGMDTLCIHSQGSYSVVGNDSYQWSNGTTGNSSTYTINGDTIISVAISNDYCSIVDSLAVYSIDSNYFEILGELNYCENQEYLLYTNNGSVALWNNGQFSDSISGILTSDLEIYAEVVNGFCPSFIDSVQLSVDSIPVISVNSPVTLNPGDVYPIDVEGQAISWNWTPSNDLSCSNCQNPTLTLDAVFTYVVSADVNGCIAYDTLEILLISFDDCILFPTAFSPNGDNVNDVFRPVVIANNVKVKSFNIYNRWGEKLYSGTEYWDGTFKGKAQNVGVYVYTINYSCDGKDETVSGNVSLIR